MLTLWKGVVWYYPSTTTLPTQTPQTQPHIVLVKIHIHDIALYQKVTRQCVLYFYISPSASDIRRKYKPWIRWENSRKLYTRVWGWKLLASHGVSNPNYQTKPYEVKECVLR